MEVCILGSGSSGNCTYVSAGGTRVLIDAGLGYKDTCTRLGTINVPLSSIHGVLITHDHDDHAKSASAIRRRHNIDLYANEGTVTAVERSTNYKKVDWAVFENGSPFNIGHLHVEAFQVPHDAADTVGFVITHDRIRLGIATDLGIATPQIEKKLADCDALILETNHDPEMLLKSKRGPASIARIRGPRGHLSNEDAAELLSRVLCPRLRTVFMAHRSAECNTLSLAERALRDALIKAGREDIRLVHTHAATSSDRIDIQTTG